MRRDLRCDHPWAPYDQLEVAMATQRNGDVAARVAVRFDEVLESLRLIRALCADLPSGAVRADLRLPPREAHRCRLGRGLARRGLRRARTGGADGAASGAAMRTTRRGTTGRCWNMR